MNKVKLTALAVAASLMVGAVGSVTTSTAAEAGSVVKVHFKKKGRHFHRHRHFGYHHGYYNPYRQCRWLKRKARRTGSRYWWREYRICMSRYYH
ncbi:MAG: hypothetical protein AAF468_00895 [Pseudomonadota bacterium]